jgi:hypothetical protein
MEKLLKSIGSDDDTVRESANPANKKRKKEHATSVQDNTIPSDKPQLTSQTVRGKVVRYHGSSSGYYLVGNILSDNNHELVLDEESDDQQQQKVYVVPSFNNGQNYRLRRMNVNDDDLMVVRDTTADEEACQLAADGQETINEIVPRQVLTSLVHT